MQKELCQEFSNFVQGNYKSRMLPAATGNDKTAMPGWYSDVAELLEGYQHFEFSILALNTHAVFETYDENPRFLSTGEVIEEFEKSIGRKATNMVLQKPEWFKNLDEFDRILSEFKAFLYNSKEGDFLELKKFQLN